MWDDHDGSAAGMPLAAAHWAVTGVTGSVSSMTNDPRSALNRLIAAFEAHLDAAATGDELSPAVVAAENALQDAFFTYDDALFTAFGIELPFDTFDGEGDEDDYDDDDDDDVDEDDEDDYDGEYDDEDEDEDDYDPEPPRS